jgi:hypothetical protein
MRTSHGDWLEETAKPRSRPATRLIATRNIRDIRAHQCCYILHRTCPAHHVPKNGVPHGRLHVRLWETAPFCSSCGWIFANGAAFTDLWAYRRRLVRGGAAPRCQRKVGPAWYEWRVTRMAAPCGIVHRDLKPENVMVTPDVLPSKAWLPGRPLFVA